MLCSSLSLGSSFYALADLPTGEGSSQVQESLLSINSILGVQVLFFFSLSFYPVTWRSFLSFQVFRGLLLVFSRCPVRTTPFVDVYLMHLWEEVSSTFCYSDILIGVSGLYTILIFDVEKYLDLLPIYYSYQFFFFFSPTTIGIHLPHIHGMVFSTTLIFFTLFFSLPDFIHL